MMRSPFSLTISSPQSSSVSHLAHWGVGPLPRKLFFLRRILFTPMIRHSPCLVLLLKKSPPSYRLCPLPPPKLNKALVPPRAGLPLPFEVDVSAARTDFPPPQKGFLADSERLCRFPLNFPSLRNSFLRKRFFFIIYLNAWFAPASDPGSFFFPPPS